VGGDTHKVMSSLLCWFFITDGMFYLQSVVWVCSANLIDVLLLFPVLLGFSSSYAGSVRFICAIQFVIVV
jgi:hypothetical protein